MSSFKHLVIIAGEESGDIFAGQIIKQLKIRHPDLKISGIGGAHMQGAGASLVSDLARFGVTGFSEVLKHFWTIKKAYKKIQHHLRENKPDLLVLIDYPGFNLRLAQYAKKKLGLRILYYISPQIWAWKANRINIIKQCVDHMAVIFPFEKKIYEKAGIKVSFVGHPLVETLKPIEDPEALRQRLGLPKDKRLLAMLPGSRQHEIDQHMPVLQACAQSLYQKYPDLHFVIPVAKTISLSNLQAYFQNSPCPISFIEGQAREVVACSEVVVVASGTASLECALLVKPMCIIYKTSFLTYVAASVLLRVKYIGLCNILSNAMIVPELLQYDCTSQTLTNCLSDLLMDEKLKKNMINNLRSLRCKMSLEMSDGAIVDLISREIFFIST